MFPCAKSGFLTDFACILAIIFEQVTRLLRKNENMVISYIALYIGFHRFEIKLLSENKTSSRLKNSFDIVAKIYKQRRLG